MFFGKEKAAVKSGFSSFPAFFPTHPILSLVLFSPLLLFPASLPLPVSFPLCTDGQRFRIVEVTWLPLHVLFLSPPRPFPFPLSSFLFFFFFFSFLLFFSFGFLGWLARLPIPHPSPFSEEEEVGREKEKNSNDKKADDMCVYAKQPKKKKGARNYSPFFPSPLGPP